MALSLLTDCVVFAVSSATLPDKGNGMQFFLASFSISFRMKAIKVQCTSIWDHVPFVSLSLNGGRTWADFLHAFETPVSATNVTLMAASAFAARGIFHG